MSEALPDLFPGFESRTTSVGEVEIFARTGGSGPPLLLLHGYPQTHACWHKVAPSLAERFTVVAMDLRGYGQSAVPEPADDHSTYSKRAMARDAVGLMAALGFPRFHLAGHDRGGRVAYRLALDHPAVVERLAVLDIVTTAHVWRGMDWSVAIKSYHWPFLAQPHPLPERLISAEPQLYADWTLASWTLGRDLGAFDPGALAHYRALVGDSRRVRAFCEDYRAGATIDRDLDEADLAAGHKIGCPVLALWGTDYVGKSAASPLDLWREIAADVRGQPIKAGHFLAEEAPEETAAALLGFFEGTSS